MFINRQAHPRFLSALLVLLALSGLRAETNRIVIRPGGTFAVQQTLDFPGPASQAALPIRNLPDSLRPGSFLIRPATEGLRIEQIRFSSRITTDMRLFLQTHLGQPVEVIDTADHAFKGRLDQATPEGLILRQDQTGKSYVLFFPHIKAVQTPRSDDEAACTLVYSSELESSRARMLYESSGLVCTPEYLVLLDEKNHTLDLEGRFLLENQSGTTWSNFETWFLDAAFESVPPRPTGREAQFMLEYSSSGQQIAWPEKVFEYQRYLLPTSQAFRAGIQFQIPFLSRSSIPYVKSYYCQQSGSVWVRCQITNRTGLPLPPGRGQLFLKEGQESSAIGSTQIPRTLREAPLSVTLAPASDIRLERAEKDRKLVSDKTYDLTIEYTIRNNRTEPVTVEIESFAQTMIWDIRSSTLAYRKNGTRSVSFFPSLKPGEETVFSYVMRIQER
jgi:hypothetical protein